MKIRASVFRKAGNSNFGSDGASCEIEIEVPDNANTASVVGSIFSDCREAVNAELFAQANDPVTVTNPSRAEDPRQPAPQQQAPPSRYGQPQATVPAPAASKPPWGKKTYGNGGGGGGGDRPPRYASELWGWAKASESRIAAIKDWAKEAGLSATWKEWPQDAIPACYEAVKDC